MQRLASTGDDRGAFFDPVVRRVLPSDASVTDQLRARTAFDTVGAALFAARGTDASDQDVLEAARTATSDLTAPEHSWRP